MKWTVAELVTDPDNLVLNDEDELVPYISWVRRNEEFPKRPEAEQWIAQQQNKLLDPSKPDTEDNQRFQARRLEDRIATPEELGIVGLEHHVLLKAAGQPYPEPVWSEAHDLAANAMVERGLLKSSDSGSLELTDVGKQVMRVS